MEKVSVIIPVYNVEKYLNQCLESVCNQTYKKLEIILVDDGSTDKSLEIEKKWQKKDSRIILLNQKNKGSGPARNLGLKKATGKYVMFVDSDDWIDLEMVDDLINQIIKNKVDFLSTGMVEEYFDDNNHFIEKVFDSLETKVIIGGDCLHKKYIEFFLKGAIGGPVRKIYDLNIIKNNNIVFPDLRRSQDIIFNYRYFDYINSMMTYDSNYYHYRIITETYNNKIKPDYYKTVCLMFNDIKTLLEKWKVTLNGKEEKSFIDYFYKLIVWQISIGESESVMADIVNNETVQEIIGKSNPVDLKQKILNVLIKHKKYRLINKIIRIIKNK